MAAAGILMIVFLLAFVLGAPLVWRLDPTAIHRGLMLAPPSHRFPFGTDELGRDLLARVVAGARISLLVGSTAALLGGVFGVASGLLAGYFGHTLDAVVMRTWDALLAFPGALLGIAAATAIGAGLNSVVIAGALTGLPFFSRLVRADTLVEKEREYVTAARSLGAGHLWVLVRHLLPNTLAPALVQASNLVGQAILLEAALSFLGLGIQPPEPSLGTMLYEARTYLGVAPWYSIYPGVTLVILVVAVNFLADGLHELMLPGRG
jgi:peptide/nickel transport system permease protein